MSKILSCDLHDYLEIACLYRYKVKLLSNAGESYVGVPQTTLIKAGSSNKQEVLIFCCENGEEVELELLTLREMHVLTPQAKFSSVKFR